MKGNGNKTVRQLLRLNKIVNYYTIAKNGANVAVGKHRDNETEYDGVQVAEVTFENVGKYGVVAFIEVA